jgi:hypothetical protein
MQLEGPYKLKLDIHSEQKHEGICTNSERTKSQKSKMIQL